MDYMIAGYYQARGWTQDGLIPDSKLAKLGLLESFANVTLPHGDCAVGKAVSNC